MFGHNERTHCDCGQELSVGREFGWGDWKCRKCCTAYCQDCGAQINAETGECIAYEDMKKEWDGEYASDES
jgi:hypothetical protein